jgi:hypothetical protein
VRRGYGASRSRIPTIYHSHLRRMDREFQSHVHIYMRLSTSTNELVSKHMARAV